MSPAPPSPLLAAGGGITPGEHWTVEVAGLEINLDTVIGTFATAGRPTVLRLRLREREGEGVRSASPEGYVGVRVAEGIEAA